MLEQFPIKYQRFCWGQSIGTRDWGRSFQKPPASAELIGLRKRALALAGVGDHSLDGRKLHMLLSLLISH